MAAQTDFLTYTCKTEPADVCIGTEPGIKKENRDDSPSSSEEPSASSAGMMDWEGAFADGAKLCTESAERSGVSPAHGDVVRDLSSINESPVQPILQSFPVSVIAGKPRRFTSHWYSKYGTWLEYSVEKDAVFCKVCRHFGINLIADKFTRGFRNWKRTHQACAKHELSKAHNTALCKFTNYRESQQTSREALVNHLDTHSNLSPGQNNRDHIKVILDVVMFCVRQHISPNAPKENDLTNFQELFHLLSKYDPKIQSRCDTVPMKKNSIPGGSDIQNDLIDAAASLLLRQIKQELHTTKNTYYAILADECSDRSERNLVAVCLRYLCDNSIRERVVGFVDIGDTGADGIALEILQILEPFELDPGLCVGFGFDGTPVMSGVQSALKSTFYTRWACIATPHRLNGVLCKAAKACPDYRTFFETVKALRSFLTHGAHTKARFLQIQKEMHPSRRIFELDCGAPQTHLSFLSDMFHLFDVVLELLSEFAESGGQVGLEAQSLLQQVQTKKFTFLLVASCKLSHASDYASKALRNETLQLTECIESIECLKQNLADLRHSGFDRIWAVSDELTERNQIENWDVTFSRKRKLPSRDDSAVSASLQRSSRVRCADDLRVLWYQILDSQIKELDGRFHQDFYRLMKAAAALCSHGASDLAETVCARRKSFGVEVSDAELSDFSRISRKSVGSLIEVFDTCSEENFPKSRLLIQILLTLPIAACTEGRICSSLNKLKTASRSTMLTAQLNPLSLLSFEKDLTDNLDYDEIIDIFYFIKFIKPFISQGKKVECVNQPSITWKPIIPVRSDLQQFAPH